MRYITNNNGVIKRYPKDRVLPASWVDYTIEVGMVEQASVDKLKKAELIELLTDAGVDVTGKEPVVFLRETYRAVLEGSYKAEHVNKTNEVLDDRAKVILELEAAGIPYDAEQPLNKLNDLLAGKA